MFRFGRFQVFYDAAGDPAPGGAPASGAPPPAATPAGSPPAGGPPATGTVPAPGAPAAGTPPAARPGYQYAEDRSKWIPPHRLQEMTERTKRLERQYEQQQQRVRALMGVDEPPNPKHAELRQALTEIMPELALLGKNPQALQKVLDLIESGQFEQLTSSDRAGWGRHAREMTNLAVDAYAKAAGLATDKLPPNAVRKMARALDDFVGEDRTGERLRRYEEGDPALIKECIEDLTGFFVAPIRALGQQHGARLTDQNRRLPSQGPRGGVPPAGPPAKRTREEKAKAAREFVLNGEE